MFDPYHKWLGIPREEQPPNHYRLLGISPFESDPDVIDAAANRQMAYLQGCATGTQALLSQRLLNEVAAARLCLLNPEKKIAYDARLKAKQSRRKEVITPPEQVSEQISAPGVRRNTSDKRFPVLEGIDEEAEPYHVTPVPTISRRSRSYARKKSRLPVVASVLLFLVAVLIVEKIYRYNEPNEIRATDTQQPRGEEQHKQRIERRNTAVDDAIRTSPIQNESLSDSSSRTVAHSTKLIPRNIQDGPPGEILQFTGHGAGVLCVAFSPDGRYAVSGSRDRTIRVWDYKTGEEIRKFEGHELGVWGISIAKDQHRLASCGPDSTARLWDFETGTELRTFRGHKSWIGSVLIANGGSALISSSAHSDDPTTRRWDTKSGVELQRLYFTRA